MPKFRERPKEVEAIQWDGSPETLAAIEKLTGQADLRGPGDSLTVDGPEGPSVVRLGWLVVMDRNGAYGCSPEHFAKRYEVISTPEGAKRCRFIGSNGYDSTCTTCGAYTSDFERRPITCPELGAAE